MNDTDSMRFDKTKDFEENEKIEKIGEIERFDSSGRSKIVHRLGEHGLNSHAECF